MENEFRQFLESLSELVGNIIDNPYKHLLQHGVYFEPANKPDDISWGEKKQCYMNATRLATTSMRRHTYCEGYAISTHLGVPLQHAWVWDCEREQVIDNTWRGEVAGYFGIPFTHNFLHSFLCNQKHYGGLIFARDFLQSPDRDKHVSQLTTIKTGD